MMHDVVDIVMSSELLKRVLMLENIGHPPGQYYVTVERGLRTRMEKYEEESLKFPTGEQWRNKIKNVKAECKQLVLMKKTASGIERERAERGYGNWWNSFYELIVSTATANSHLIEEPSASEGTSNDLSDMGIEAVNTHVDQDAEIGNVSGTPIKEKFQLDLIPPNGQKIKVFLTHWIK